MPREAATVTTTELAEELGVHRNTVLYWIEKKRIKVDWETPVGWNRWRPSSVERIRRRMLPRAA